MGPNVERAGITPRKQLREEGAVLLLSVHRVVISKLVHITGEDSGVRVADKEKSEIAGIREDMSCVRKGIIGEVAQAGREGVVCGGKVSVCGNIVPFANEVFPVRVCGFRNWTEEETGSFAYYYVGGEG